MEGFENPDLIKYDFIELGLKTRADHGFVKSAAFHEKEKIESYFKRTEFQDESCPDLQTKEVFQLMQIGSECIFSHKAIRNNALFLKNQSQRQKEQNKNKRSRMNPMKAAYKKIRSLSPSLKKT